MGKEETLGFMEDTIFRVRFGIKTSKASFY